MKNYLSEKNDGWNFDTWGDAFEDLFGINGGGKRHNDMKTDIKETENGYELSVDMPGFEKSDINLSLKNGYLTVTAKREEKEEDNKKYVRRERSFSCSRSYYVGDKITEEDVKAKYDKGTLMLFVPKNEKKELPAKRIEIE
ncbi:MAG TPA: hypothetical protein DEV87_05450 [Clostridiales bacterium]|mgnify:CR=1 FL=1|nr:hypothetical protein [Clostridiales bacterium]